VAQVATATTATATAETTMPTSTIKPSRSVMPIAMTEAANPGGMLPRNGIGRIMMAPSTNNTIPIRTLPAESVTIDEDAPRVELSLDSALPEIVTDGGRLRTALVNILANARDAVHGIPSNGNVNIELVTSRVEDNKICIKVRDRGEGIPAENLAKIFEPYFTGKRTGTGLGLAITKNIIESLGGTVTATSAPHEGTEIRVDLFLGG